MLRRDRQIRTQIHQLADACLFAVSFWIAFALRADPQIIAWLNLDPLPADIFDQGRLALLCLDSRRAALLESQGFYNRPAFVPALGHRLAALQRLLHHDRRPGADHVCLPLCFAARGDGVFWRHQFQPGLPERGTGPVGVAQQVRPIPISSAASSSSPPATKSRGCGANSKASRTTASKSWRN